MTTICTDNLVETSTAGLLHVLFHLHKLVEACAPRTGNLTGNTPCGKCVHDCTDTAYAQPWYHLGMRSAAITSRRYFTKGFTLVTLARVEVQ